MNSTLESLFFPVALGIIALLYASVGQAGATGYIAVMGLIGFGPDVIKPTALALNILVAAIGSVRFARAVSSSGQFYKDSGRPRRAALCLTSDIIDLGQNGTAKSLQA